MNRPSYSCVHTHVRTRTLSCTWIRLRSTFALLPTRLLAGTGAVARPRCLGLSILAHCLWLVALQRAAPPRNANERQRSLSFVTCVSVCYVALFLLSPVDPPPEQRERDVWVSQNLST